MIESIVIGGGCFWCLEAVFNKLKGVKSVVSGYAGGHIKNPAYREVCNGTTGHAEVIKIDYDSDVISKETLLELFFSFHDPTTLNRQGNDVGTQYRSVVFYKDESEKKEIEDFISGKASMMWNNPIVTEIAELPVFYPAEDYHQSYFDNNKMQPYCMIVINPKVKKLKQKYSTLLVND